MESLLRKRQRNEIDFDSEYFSLYSTIEIHREMLEDQIRTKTYEKAIEMNKLSINNGKVLDIGMGTGILSYFAAKNGAKKVYGVEACYDMAKQVQNIINHNKFQDIIEIKQGLMEKVEIPEKVDIIISEWMGYMLIYESMLDSIIYARDKYLKPNGKILPSRCEILMTPFSEIDFNDNEDYEFWNNVYGFDFSPIKPFVRYCLTKEPQIEVLSPHFQMALRPCSIKKIDCMTVTTNDISIYKEFTFTSIFSGDLHGFAIWFNAEFDTDKETIILYTGPEKPETHWCQTLLRLTDPLSILLDQEIKGSISIEKCKDQPRSLNINLILTKPKNISKNYIFE